MRFALILLVALLSACTIPHACNGKGSYSVYVKHDPPVVTVPRVTPVWVDKDFPASQKADVLAAIDEWNFALNGYSSFQVVDQNYDMEPSVLEQIRDTLQGLVILDVSVKMEQVQRLPDGVLAWVPELEANSMFIIGDRIGNRALKSIVMHELGHILGLEHQEEAGTLMFPSYDRGSPCIDQVTAMHLASVHSRYNWHHMNYCEPR